MAALPGLPAQLQCNTSSLPAWNEDVPLAGRCVHVSHKAINYSMRSKNPELIGFGGVCLFVWFCFGFLSLL